MRAGADAADAHHHDAGEAKGEDHRLTGVKHGQRRVGLDAHRLVARHGTVVALRLARLGAEVFDRLVVEQAVDRLGVGVGVALVHRAPDRHPPVRRDEGPGEIDEDHAQHDADVAEIELEEEHHQDQRELHRRGYGCEHDDAHDGLDGVATPLQHTGQATGLALQMEAEAELMQVDEDLLGQTAHRVHGDGGEERVATLRGEAHEDAQDAVERDQGDGPEEQAEHIVRGLGVGARLARHGVRRPLERVGHRHRDELGDQHEREGDVDPLAQVDAGVRPHVGGQLAQHGRQTRLRLVRRSSLGAGVGGIEGLVEGRRGERRHCDPI